MAVSFETLLTSIRRNLRDPNSTTWSDAQLGELIEQGIDAVSSIYPNEGVESVAYTVPTQGAIHSYTLSAVNWPIRVDVYNSDSKYAETIKPTVGEGADSGWDYFNGKLELPTHYAYSSNTGTLRVYGYKPWLSISPTYTTASVAISPSTVTTDLNDRAQYAVKVFVAAEALSMLMFDRAQFQQWTVVGGNTDVTALGLNNLAAAAQARWRLEKTRIRTIRRLG
jgi:hypothetical protein